MGTTKSAIIAASVFGLVAETGFMFQPSLTQAMEGQKATGSMQQEGEENVPGNIQRSTPSGKEFPGSGTGPGNRDDQLTVIEEVEPAKNPTDQDTLMKEKGIDAESKKGKH